MARKVCPVWIGHILANPLRKYFDNPDKLVGDYVNPGMTVLDVGCAMGFFTIPMARMVGPAGKIIAVDLQPKMIVSLKKRAIKFHLDSRIETRTCESSSLNIDDLKEQIDFALAFHMVHETPDAFKLYEQVFLALKSGGKMFVAEPKGHIPTEEFDRSVALAQNVGFKVIGHPKVRSGHSVLLQKI